MRAVTVVIIAKHVLMIMRRGKLLFVSCPYLLATDIHGNISYIRPGVFQSLLQQRPLLATRCITQYRFIFRKGYFIKSFGHVAMVKGLMVLSGSYKMR